MIAIFILLVVIFILMTAFPFILSLRSPKDENGTLVVRSDNKKEPRYFPEAFKVMVKKALQQGTADGIMVLSKPEKFVYSHNLKDNVINDLVICNEGFIAVGPATFEKEIYSENTVVLDENIEARAVAANKLLLMKDCRIIRWCDGEKEAYIGHGCDLGISATSKEYLQVMEKCTFRRLYAPQVDIMSEGDTKHHRREKRVPVQENMTVRILPEDEYDEVEKDVKEISADSTIKGNVITKNTLVIKEGTHINGHIKSRKDIVIEKNVFIHGNVFAEGKIDIQSDVCITGDVFSQEDIYVGYNSVIGQRGKVKSVVAKSRIFLCEEVTIFGYIGCDDCGYTVNREEK